MLQPKGETVQFMRQLLPESRFPGFLEKCGILMDFLYETNQTLNLTRIPEESFWSLHVADSLALAREAALDGKKLCDVGCGAGFPSLILAAAFPDLLVTAVDSTRKKVDFVAAAAEKMGLPNLTAIHARANELARKEDFHAAYDFVTARAVADASVLIRETALFLNHKHGVLCIYRTTEQLEREIPDLNKRKLNYRITPLFELPESAGTRLFLFLPSQKSMVQRKK